MNIINKLFYYFEFPFVRYAVIVGVLIALCASMLGVVLVLKRYSMIGDGLSHVAFGATAIAAALNISSDIFITLPLTAVCAVILLKIGNNSKINGDSAIAMFSVAALAFGYLLLNVTSTEANVSGDVCTTLFGSTSILTLKKGDVYTAMALTVILLAAFLLFYNKIFAVTFDENFAKSTGIKTECYNTAFAIVTAVVIVLAMKLAGALLISALIVFPALSAMRIFKRFFAVITGAACIAVLCAVFGMVVSILFETPTGATIVAADFLAYVVFYIIGFIKSRA